MFGFGFMRRYLDPDGGQGGDPNTQPPAGGEPSGQTGVQIDYEKIAQIVAGKQSATEDSVLKGYFKQQGMSEEDMKQAIASFKQQKAASQPDVNAMQTQLTQAQQIAQQAMLDKEATLVAIGLGLDSKSIPYILKMADLSQAVGQDGNVNGDTIKTALNKVLEDIPALKPQQQQTSGFQVGNIGNGQQPPSGTDAELDRIFGVKK